MNHTSRIVLLAAAGAVAACSYAYKNPAEDLLAGSIAGRALVSAVPTEGVAVSVKGASVDQATRPTGRFLILPLPAGRHTVLFRSASGGALVRDVEIAYGKDGQPEGVNIGDVAIPAASSIGGSATSSLAVAASFGTSFTWMMAVDGLTGATAQATGGGTFLFSGVSPGAHPISIVATDGVTQYVGGPVVVQIGDADAGLQKLMTPPGLHPVTPGHTGRVQVRLRAIGSLRGFAISDYAILGLPGGGTPDSSGLVDVTVDEGHYPVRVVGPTAGMILPPPVDVVVTESSVTDLGTLYVTDALASSESMFSCLADADCAPGTCIDHVCQGAFNPIPVVPASTPLCDSALIGCDPASPTLCTQSGGAVSMTCEASVPSGINVCMQANTCCTPGGKDVVCGPLLGT